MWRRCSIAVVLAGLALVAGCGLIQRASKTHEAPPPEAVKSTFDASVNLVVSAALDATGPDFRFDFDAREGFDFPNMTVKWAQGMKGLNKILDDGVIPAKGTVEADLAIDAIDFGSGSILGRLKDGRPVKVWFLERDQGRKTEVCLRIGKIHEAGLDGDTELSLTYFNRIADKLDQPKGESALKFSVDFPIIQAATTEAQPPAKGGLDR